MSALRGRPYLWLGVVALAVVVLIVALRPGAASTAYARDARSLYAARMANADRITPADVRASFATGRTLAPMRTPTGPHWLGSWAASPQAPTLENKISMSGFHDQTVRQLVFLSSGGSMVRVHLTNAYGQRPLRIAGASVAISRGGGAVRAGSVRPLLFSGRQAVVIRPGGQVVSDPVDLKVVPLQRLAISLYLPAATGPATGHYGAHLTNFVAGGDHALDATGKSFGVHIASWFFLSAVDTLSPPRFAGAVVTLGDSITAGVGSKMGAYANYPDDLARRLASTRGETMSVLNEGIGGNRVLNGSECCGAAATARFAPDVRAQAGARDVILLEGVNDIGYSQQTNPLTAPHTNVSAQQIIAGDEQIIAAAHAAGLRIFGATLLPFRGARYWTPAGEAKRDALNDWILHGGAFDGVIDFASVMGDPGNPERLNPAFDSGDHLHPNDAGYRAMANAVSLQLLLHG